MRRVKRVLLSDHGEAILVGLFQHKLHRLDLRLQSMLTTTVITHKKLRAALEGDLGRDGWGVLHRALRILAEVGSRLEVSMRACDEGRQLLCRRRAGMLDLSRQVRRIDRSCEVILLPLRSHLL